ncbi:MAG: AraC family transcriptional regulator [Tannerellaceae bacterium]|jgi:AraC-like DNA-binding protein|nr:AraC family transcriptional regulator [Tannerellaceae bacterium]
MNPDTFNFTLLNAACKIHHADWNWKNVNSPFARLYVVKNGVAKVIMPDGIHIIQPGYLYLIPSFITHGYESDSTFTHYYFHIYNEYDFFDLHSFPFEIEACELDSLLVNRLLAINPNMELKRSDPRSYDNTQLLAKRLSDGSPNLVASMETKGILSQLLSRFLYKAQPKNNISEIRIIKALQYIHEHIYEDITINEVARYCNLNSDHFTRIFKKEMAITPLFYINKRKIEKAQLMLALNRKTVKEIAYELSFNNMTHFNKLFNKMVGVSPKTYRKTALYTQHL